MSNNFSQNESSKPVQTLFNAVSSIKLRLVRLLIEGGIDIDTRNDLEQTPLLAVCASLQNNHLGGETRAEVVKYLLSEGASVNVQDKCGRTPLIYAIITQALPTVIFDLVQAGAELWVEDSHEKCAFDYVFQRNDMRLATVMVEAYKQYNSPRKKDRATILKKLSGLISSSKNVLTSARRKSSSADRNTQRYLNLQKQKERQRENANQDKSAKKPTSKGTPGDNAGRKRSSTDNRGLKEASVDNVERKRSSTDNREQKSTAVDIKGQHGAPVRECNGTFRDNDAFMVDETGQDVAAMGNWVQRSTPGDQWRGSFWGTSVDNPEQGWCDPESPLISHYAGVSEHVLCRLCRSIVHVADTWPEADSGLDDPQMTSMQEYNLSGLIYRRRSTGSSLPEEQCHMIQRKKEMGITLEDLFSAKAINRPPNGADNTLFVKDARSDTDISGKSLLVPTSARSRSLSVTLPPKDQLYLGGQRLSGRSLSFTASDDDPDGDGILLGPRPPRKPLSLMFNHGMPQSPQPTRRQHSIQRIYMTSSDSEDWDDIVVIPSSQKMTSSDGLPSPGNAADDDISARNSPIPTITLTETGRNHGNDDESD